MPEGQESVDLPISKSISPLTISKQKPGTKQADVIETKVDLQELKEKKDKTLRRLSNEARNIILAWDSKGLNDIGLGQDIITLVTIIKIADMYHIDRKTVSDALLRGWNDGLCKVHNSILKKKMLVRYEWDENSVPEEDKKLYGPLTLRDRLELAQIRLKRRYRGLNPKRHYRDIQEIVQEAVHTWDKDEVNFDTFTEPFLKIADFDIPREYFEPEKGGRIIGLTLLDPVLIGYHKALGENKLVFKREKVPPIKNI